MYAVITDPNEAQDIYRRTLNEKEKMMMEDSLLGMDDSMFSMATSASFFPGITDADKLRLAASKGQLDKVKELVAARVSFEPDKEGRTALHYAALNGFGECVQLLAIEGCEIDLQDNMGYTALHRAAAQGHLDVIKVLITEGAVVDKQDEVHGNAALHEAAWNGYSRTLELLCKAKANVHLVNKAGFSALHLAAQNGHNQSARVLLYAGASPDHRNNYGDTSLHTACRYGHAGVTRILVSARCRISEQNKNGDTGLHIAAALKRRKITNLLLESGIDVNVRNKQNETAIDVAKRKDHSDVVMAITSKPKTKKDLKKKKDKKSEKEKLMVELDGEKKKKGFFFRKKSKAKAAQENDKVYSGAAPSITAASEITTSHYDHVGQMMHHAPPGAHMHPHLYNNNHHYQHVVPRARAQGTLTGPGAGSVTGATSLVSGVAAQYQPKNGTQVYRDLAGNIKQGPVGYAPVCNCGPMMKRIEQKMDGDRANMYDHIDASHRTLADRIDHLDRRAAQQIYALDKLTKERFDSERQDHMDRMEKRFLRERLDNDQHLDSQCDNLRTELKAWVDTRLTNFEKQYGNFHADCSDDLLAGRKHSKQSHLLQAGAGDALPGALYRTKSDETLSMSSSHPGKKHSRLYQKAIHDLKKMRQNGQRLEKRTRGIAVRDHPVGGPNMPNGHHQPHQNNPMGRPLTFHEDLSPIVSRSPEGNSGNGDFSEADNHESLKLNSTSLWSQSQRKYNEGDGKSPTDSVQQLKTHFNNMGLNNNNNKENRIPRNVGDGSRQAFSKNSSVDSQAGMHTSQPYTMASFNDDYSNGGYHVRQYKSETGSNPDSGYHGGKSKTVVDVHVDQHNSSIATTASTATDGSSPHTFNSTSEGGSDRPSISPQGYNTSFTDPKMDRWMQRRSAQEQDRKVDNIKSHLSKESIRMNPAIASRHGTQV